MSELYSHSRVNTFKMCPKLFEYKYIQKLVPLGQDTKALSMGKAFHTGIEHASVQACIDYMNQDEYFMSQDDEVDKAICMAMVEAFIKKYPECKKWRHEEHFTFDLLGTGEDNFQLYVDGLEEHENGYYIVELKTASMLNDAYFKKLEFNDQISRYWHVCEQKLDKPILGVKYYVVKKPLLRLKKTETIQQYINRLVDRLMEDDSIIDLVIHRTPDQVKDCILDTISDIELIQNTKRFTKNLSACSVYGTCPYMELCMGTKDAELLFVRKDDEDVTEEREST